MKVERARQVLDDLAPVEFDEFVRLDTHFRLPLILAAADDRKVRRGLCAEYLAKELVGTLANGPAKRKAELILACALAEQGDFEKALEYVGGVAKQKGLTPDEANKCRKLTAQFEDETPLENLRRPEERADSRHSHPRLLLRPTKKD